MKCKLLLNSKVWHGLTTKQKVRGDRQELFEDFAKQVAKVALESLFLLVGVMPLKYEIMLRRLMYLWKLLHVDENELSFEYIRARKIHQILEIG